MVNIVKSIAATASAAVLSIGLASTAQAAVVFTEDFDDEATNFGTQLNHIVFDKFTVASGTVDLISGSSGGVTCVSGGCVDLDGSNLGDDPASIFETTSTINFLPGIVYTLSFQISGSQRTAGSPTNTVEVEIDNGVLATQSITKANADPFALETFNFSVGAATSGVLRFTHLGTSDFQGLLIDDISITDPTPPPPTGVSAPPAWPMLLAAIPVLAWMRRFKR